MSVMDITVRDTTLDAARSGDPRAFVSLLEPHRQALWAVCLRVTNHPAAAVDALALGLGGARRSMSELSRELAFGIWLSRTMAAAARTVAWHQQRIRTPRREVKPPETAAERRLRARLAALPVVVREAIVLREVCGLTFEQVAAHQVVGVHTVKNRLKLGRDLPTLDDGPCLDRALFDQLLRTVLVRQHLEVLQRSESR